MDTFFPYMPWDGLIRTAYECGGPVPDEICAYRNRLRPLESVLTLEELCITFKLANFSQQDLNYLNSRVLDLIQKITIEDYNKSHSPIIIIPWARIQNNDQFLFFWRFRDEISFDYNIAPFLIECLKYSRKMFEELFEEREIQELNCFTINDLLYYFAFREDINTVRYLCEMKIFDEDTTMIFLARREGIVSQVWDVLFSYIPFDNKTLLEITHCAYDCSRYFIKFASTKKEFQKTLSESFADDDFDEEILDNFVEEKIPIILSCVPAYNILTKGPVIVTDENGKKYEVCLKEI